MFLCFRIPADHQNVTVVRVFTNCCRIVF